MKTMMVTVAAVLVLGAWHGHVSAGETKTYLRSGYFQWTEKIGGSDFVKERGAITTLGVARSDDLSAVQVQEAVEVWGGSLDYDGHDITNTTVLKSDTIYLGTREEIGLTVKIPVGERVTVGPVGGAGHKFWLRSRSNEDWNLFYGRLGAGTTYGSGPRRIWIAGGITLPFSTRNHVDLSAAGYEDVVTYPKGKPSPYVEASIRWGAWSVGVTYEELNFDQSAKVTARAATPYQNGVVVIDSQAFQPQSRSSLLSAAATYHF